MRLSNTRGWDGKKALRESYKTGNLKQGDSEPLEASSALRLGGWSSLRDKAQ